MKKKIKMKKRLAAVAKPKVLRKKLVARQLEISNTDIEPEEVESEIRSRRVYEDEEMESENNSANTAVIALIIFSLLISFAYTTCFHFLYQYAFPVITNSTDEIKEVPADDVPVEITGPTYDELETRLDAIEPTVKGYIGAGHEYPQLIERLDVAKPVLEEIFMNSYGLTYSMYENGISSHEDMVEDIKNINQAYAKLDQSLKSVESVAKGIPIESLEKTYFELEKRLNTVKSMIAEAQFAAWIPELLEKRLKTMQFLVEDLQSTSKTNTEMTQIEKTEEMLWKEKTALESSHRVLSRDLAPMKPKLEVLLMMKRPESCSSISAVSGTTGNKMGGIFQIFPKNLRPSFVYCDDRMDGGGWTVFQRRLSGHLSFQREWKDYVVGFGNLKTEFWLGLEKLSQWTSDGYYELRIELIDWDRKAVYAKYANFTVGGASTRYKLSVSGYTGTAGDSFGFHNGMKFSTTDADNDEFKNFWRQPDHSCPQMFKGGWWYKRCLRTNLNGIYYPKNKNSKKDGMSWYNWKNDWTYSMKFTEMKFRPKTRK